MTCSELIERLRAAKIQDAETEAVLLAERFAGIPPTRFRVSPQTICDTPQLQQALKRRLAGEPLQYILGEWQFYRQTYEVSPHCLIPRSDTELLVEYAVKRLPPAARFLDLCTGSGCIAVSTLAERPDTVCAALELYPETLSLACRNAKRNGVENRFFGFRGDVLQGDQPFLSKDSPFLANLADSGGAFEGFDAILSNPPYIPTGELAGLSREVLHEPRAALDGGQDGMIFYRGILAKYASLLKPTGFFLFEIGYDQRELITDLAEQQGWAVQIFRDLGGRDRMALLDRGT